ncbi:helix-turn-helix domain-containing protein [Bordetella petrii]|uniref:helix-turn-helix domain-containing protein n=1 Tax=Bordetella petrii TaxID=94624 RepID=UPI001A95FCFA|nr:helix-turn-helix domain-containing protein [Bordetella petrii]MBO1114661.1 helix-turn-helix domain-containing protein [Bordetella petrii]
MANMKKPATGDRNDSRGAHRGQYSTATEAQHARILRALRQRPHTSYELRRLGCYQANTRVLELRRKGYVIITERVSIWDEEGYQHDGVALYSLMDEPAGPANNERPVLVPV